MLREEHFCFCKNQDEKGWTDRYTLIIYFAYNKYKKKECIVFVCLLSGNDHIYFFLVKFFVISIYYVYVIIYRIILYIYESLMCQDKISLFKCFVQENI